MDYSRSTPLYYFLFSLIALLLPDSLFAQNQANGCGTDEAHNYRMLVDPDYKQAFLRHQMELDRFIKQQQQTGGNRSTGCAGEARRVPVVVHVIHLGEPIGTGSNITDAQIQGAITGLNNRWKGISGDGVDFGFEFCLASRSPQGLPTNGIVRVPGTSVTGYTTGGIAWSGSPGADEAEVKALSTWPQADYYNVWVVHAIGGGVGGYAYFPSGGPLDGTVILSGGMTMGSSTLTHELGHGFGLSHTFDGDNDGADCPPDNDCTVDGDRVCDTPPHKEGDCGMINPCSGGGDWDNSRRNYMSYCGGTTRFTAGQGVRVNAASYSNARVSLFASEGCIPADQPNEAGILRIIYPFEQPLCDDTFEPIIQLKNFGSAPLTSITIEAWVDGSLYNTSTRMLNVATGATENITLDPITLAIGGHEIIYRITDINGGGLDSYVDNNQLCTNVYYEPMVTSFPRCWDFEDGQKPESFVTQGPIIQVLPYTDPGCVDQGTTCLVFDAFNANAGEIGTQTLMALLPFDLTGMPGAALNFDVAMRRNYFADHSGTLEVLVSTDCGQSFTPVYLRRDINGGNTENLATVPTPPSLPTSSWEPTACNQWRRDIADLSPFTNQEVLVLFRFTIARNFSENLYLDNICVQECDGFAEITALQGPGVCFPDTAAFSMNTGPGFVYKWFIDKKPIVGANQSVFNTTVPGKYFGVIEADGCRFSTDTLEMLYFPAAVPTIIGNVSICEGDSATMDAGPFDAYLWSTGDTTQLIKATDPGTYTVTVTNSFGCTGVDWTQVSNKVKPNGTISGNLNFCEGGSTTINVSPFSNNVLWSTGDTTTSISVTSAGSYSVTVTGGNGCFDIKEVTVTERIPTPPVISGVLAICSGEQTTLDAGPGYAGYEWSSGPFNQMITVSMTGTYSVTVTDAFGCTAESSVDVISNVKPQPQISGQTTFCAGTLNLLDAGSQFDSYLWSTGEITPQIEVTSSGMYQVTVTNISGCTGTAQLMVTALPSPTPQINGTLDICEGESTTLNAGNNFFSYEWSTGDSGQTLIVQTSGLYIVTVTNSIGCPGVDSVTVEVHPFPLPQISGVPAICQGQQTTLDAGTGYDTYLWTGGSSSQTLQVTTGGMYSVTVTTAQGCVGMTSINVIESPNPQPQINGTVQLCMGETSLLDAGSGFNSYVWSTGASSPTISVNQSGTYQVTVTNSAGCSGQDALTVNVSPLPQVQIMGDAGFCTGGSATLTAQGGPGTFVWSNGSTGSTITVSQAGSYSVTVTDVNGCTGLDQFSVTEQSLVIPIIQSIPTTVCPGATVQLLAGGGTDYLWIEGASLLSDPNIPNPTLVVTGPITVSVEVSNSCNSEVITLQLDVTQPQGQAGPDLNVLLGREITLTASGGLSYTWSGPTSLSCINCQEPKTTPSASGYYIVEITDMAGCTTLDSVFVEVYDDLDRVLDLVNTITPNGDGMNDLLIIKGLESFDANSLTIFNRWGEQIFHQDNYQNTFNGRVKGKLVPSGSYYYILRLWPGDRIVKSVLVILHEND